MKLLSYCLFILSLLGVASCDTSESEMIPSELEGRWLFMGYGNEKSFTHFPAYPYTWMTFSQNGYYFCQATNQFSGTVELKNGDVAFLKKDPLTLIKVISPEEIIFLEENFYNIYRYAYSQDELRLYYSITDYFLLEKQNTALK